jgi:electron transfer flavoprotein alpha subunit
MPALRNLVFIKQVPDVGEMHFSENKTLVREGVKNIINPYDRRAISEAIRNRENFGGEVIVVTMGPPQARQALAEALVMGADRAIHIEDRRLAGSDTLVTAKVLSAAARKIGFDIIFAGQHSTDSETGQVPPSIAEILQISCAAAVTKLEYGEKNLNATCETDDGIMEVELPYPAVISSAERLIKPIKVKEFDPSSANYEKIETWNLNELEISENEVGLEGSPTWVADICEERIDREKRILDGSDPKEAARKMLDVIRNSSARKDTEMIPSYISRGQQQFWCLVEQNEDRIRSVSLEMIGTAAQLAYKGGNVYAIMIGAPVRTQDVVLLGAYGADRIYHVTDTAAHPDDIVDLLCDQIQKLKPFAFLMPSTPQGRAIAPRIAARLNLGLTGDCIGLRWDAEGRFEQLKPAYGGNIVAPIITKTEPKLVTIRPGALPSYRPRTGDQIPVTEWTIPNQVNRRFKILSHTKDSGSDAVKMDSASVIVGVGMGLGQDHVPTAIRLAELLRGAIGATRRVVDSGWMPRQFQIGLTGKFVAPDCYIGLGISGRANHVIGIQKAGKIIAINQDPNAEIFKHADLGIVGDCGSIVSELINILTAESRNS